MLYLFSADYWVQQYKARQAARAKAEFERGFDWAAGQLLRGKEPEELERDLDFTFDSTSFDYGASQALHTWYARNTLDSEAARLVLHTAEGCGCATHH